MPCPSSSSHPFPLRACGRLQPLRRTSSRQRKMMFAFPLLEGTASGQRLQRRHTSAHREERLHSISPSCSLKIEGEEEQMLVVGSNTCSAGTKHQ